MVLMKSRLPRLLALAATTALVASGCQSAGDDTPTVAAAFGPLAWVSTQIAGDEFRVVNLTQPGAEPHDLELGIGQVAEVERADLVVVLDGFQPAVDSAARNVAEGAVLDAADVVDLVPAEDHEADDAPGHTGHDHTGHADHEDEHEGGHDGHDEGAGGHEGHDGHDHGDLDPHFWQDPLRMADLGEAVATQLGEIDPDHAEVFTRRAADLRTRMEAIDAEWTRALARCERDTVVVTHQAFGYLGRYGLHFESISGLSPGAEPTPADLARLQQLIAHRGITTVCAEARATAKMAQTLARDAGVGTAVLDPLEAVEGEGAGDYPDQMAANLAALQQANGCR